MQWSSVREGGDLGQATVEKWNDHIFNRIGR